MHTKKFSELFASKNSSNSELMAILRDCSKVHNKLTKEAAMGNGFDRHLFVMRYYAQKEGKVPDFYLDPSYKLINHNILSTSTLAHPSVLNGGFAPVVRDGFGVGYRILDDTLGACVTSYENKDVNEFVDCLSDTFKKLRELLKSSKDNQKD
jgi:carnitine O-palmitoyltransferase 2